MSRKRLSTKIPGVRTGVNWQLLTPSSSYWACLPPQEEQNLQASFLNNLGHPVPGKKTPLEWEFRVCSIPQNPSGWYTLNSVGKSLVFLNRDFWGHSALAKWRLQPAVAYRLLYTLHPNTKSPLRSLWWSYLTEKMFRCKACRHIPVILSLGRLRWEDFEDNLGHRAQLCQKQKQTNKNLCFSRLNQNILSLGKGWVPTLPRGPWEKKV